MIVRRYLRLVLTATVALAGVAPVLAPVDRVDAAPTNIDARLVAKMSADASQKLPVIVEMYPYPSPVSESSKKLLADEAFGLLTKHGTALGEIPMINAAVGLADAKGVEAIGKNRRVAFIHEDSVVGPRLESAEPPTNYPAGLLSGAYVRAIGADKVWLEGTTGKGITVAVLDSGIYPHPDLIQPTNRLLAAVNFAGDRGSLADPGGHGTHVAGIIAGNGLSSDLSSRQSQPFTAGDAIQTQFPGVAPAANLVDVRVLNRDGWGRVSSVVRGLEWVLAHRVQYNIRVVNLSVGAPAVQSYRIDPLSAAVEIAWKRGLVVVAAAGNAGFQGATVDRPGVDPFLITVGAVDERGSLSLSDDEYAPFSAWGVPLDSTLKPDLLAPGRRIVSLRAPGSYLESHLADRIVTAATGATYFRMSGTSMSAAVVAGTVALMLERHPGLSPDQVKAILVGTTQRYGLSSTTPTPGPFADKNDLLDAKAAVSATPLPPANAGLRVADGLARALYPVLIGQPLVWRDPDYLGIDWGSLNWSNLAWDNLAWDNLAWDCIQWDKLDWSRFDAANLAWDNLAWDNLAWDNLAWDGLPWADVVPD